MLLSAGQYGFRSNSSATFAMIDLIGEVSHHIEKQEYALAVFIDLQKAFDTIDHNILITKIERIGITGFPLAWLKSYVTKQYQYVQMGEHV